MQTINPPHASNPDTAVARKTHRRVVKLVDDAGGLARLRHDHGRRSSSLMSAEHGVQRRSFIACAGFVRCNSLFDSICELVIGLRSSIRDRLHRTPPERPEERRHRGSQVPASARDLPEL